MRGRYNTTLGFYEPSVFHIHTRWNGSIGNLSSLSDQQASTFLHEYVHFLQDILTIKGLQNMYIIGEYLRFVTQQVKSSDYKAQLPIDPFAAKFNVGNNWLASSYTFGELDYETISLVSWRRDTSTQIKDDINGTKIPIGRIFVECKYPDGSKVESQFGTIQIMEGMAKMVQESVYPTTRRTSPYNPYYIAIDIANNIIAGLGNNIPTMIAIFDYALQSSNPGWAFVNYIEEKKGQGYTATTLTYQDVYNDLKNTQVLSNTLGLTNFQNGFSNLVKQAKGVFRDYTSGIWLFQNQQRWYNSLLARGEELRKNNPELFVMLASSGDIRKGTFFSQVLSVFGTPVVTNNNHEFGFVAPKNVVVSRDEMMHVYAMMQIHQVFYSDGVFTCPLRKYCQQQPCGLRKQKVDKRCVKAPWTRMRAYNRCLFNIWWKFKGFKKVEFIS